jgi:hypothetical protein
MLNTLFSENGVVQEIITENTTEPHIIWSRKVHFDTDFEQ